MNRREFLGCCIATGMTIGLSGLVSCLNSKATLSLEDKSQLSGLTIADAHAHPYQLYGSGKYDRSTPTIDMMKQVGMVASSFSALGDKVKYGGITGRPYSNTLNQLKKVKKFEEKNKVKLIRKAPDVPSLIGSNEPGAIMAIEGGDAVEGKIDNLDKFYHYGVRMITILHDHNNEIGFNMRSKSDGTLTRFGIQAVARMNKLGMIIDVAHSKTKTLKSIKEVSETPLIDSHTNPLPYGLKKLKQTRLRTWSEMDLIAKTGGVICTWPLAYSKGDAKRTMLRHWAEEIVEIKKRLGIKYVGLGTDGGGNLPQKIKGWKSILSLPKLIEAMREVGLSQDDIVAYTGGNFLRVLNQCLS
jgi:membrane dipeptidase